VGKDERSFISREEYDALLAENAELNKKLDYLMGQLRLLKQKTFGVSFNGTAANTENGYIVTVPLQEGENAIFVVVTSQDGTASRTYTVTVTKKPAPRDLVITTAQDLMNFAASVNNGDYAGITDVTVELGADIDMSGYDWTPIGIDGNHYFSGTFEGNGCTISNLTITKDTTGYFGLLGITDATIQNVNLTGSLTNTISDASGSYVGAVAGYIIGGAIRNCSTSDFTITSSSDDLTLGQAVGGIVGVAESTQVENCVSGTDITLNFEYYYIGGVAGATVGSQVINCSYTGTLALLGSGYADCGGIVGNNQQGSEISHCINAGIVGATERTSPANAALGGIVGRQDYDGGKVDFCTNAGSVTGEATFMGGIAGTATGGSIENCLNKGGVESTAGQYTGGIAGSSAAPIQACVSAGTVSAVEGTSDPIVASGSGTCTGNYYDEDVFEDEVTSNGTPVDVHTQDFVDIINSHGGNYRLNEDGQIEIIPLTYALTVEGSYAETTGAGQYEVGAQIVIDAGSRDGYAFDGWTSGAGLFVDPAASKTTFIMPAEDATVVANWVAASSPSTGNSGGSSSAPSYSPVLDVSDGGTVKVNPRTPEEGDEVTITVDPGTGYEVDEVTVTDRNGRDVSVTAGRNNTYTFEHPRGRVTISITFVREGATAFFADVPETYWAYDEIAWAYDNGYVNGTSATIFAPGTSISRQQVWMILARLSDANPANMAEARQWAIDNGISDGTNPDSAVTRQQLAALLYRFAQMNGQGFTGAWAFQLDYPDAD